MSSTYKLGDKFNLDHNFIEGVESLVGQVDLGANGGYTAQFNISSILKSANNTVQGSVLSNFASKAESIAKSVGVLEVQIEFNLVVSPYILHSE